MTGRRAALPSPGVLRVTPRGTNSQPCIRPWGGRRPVLAGVTGHCLLLQLLLHAAANAKTTSPLTPAGSIRHSGLGAPSSIPFFLTREEPRQEASWPTPEPPAAPPHRPAPRVQGATSAAARHYHREHLGWPVEALSNVSRWGGVSYHSRQSSSHSGAENQQEHVGNVSTGSNKAESFVPLRLRPSEWQRASLNSMRIGESLRSGVRPGTTGGSRHENLKGRLRRRWHPSGDNRGKIKANLVSGEAAWEVRSVQAAPLFPRRPPQSPSLSNKRKMESEHFCAESHLAPLPSLTPGTAGGNARPHGEAQGTQAAHTPASDIELMSSEESVEDSRRQEEENSGGEDWSEEDELPLAASQDYYKNPRGVLRRWKRKSKYPLWSL